MSKNTAESNRFPRLTRPITRKAFLNGALAASTAALSIPTSPAWADAPEDDNPYLTTIEIAPGVFVHQGVHGLYDQTNRGDISNAAFVVGKEAVAVIDTGGTYLIGAGLKASIHQRTNLPIRYVINTHMHPDHVFGNAAFQPDNPQFVAHHKMARGLAARAERYIAINKEKAGIKAFKGTQIVLPDRGIKTTETLDLGDRKLTLEPHPTAHTDNDLTVHDHTTNTLFLGDLLFVDHCPALDGSILGWLKVIDSLTRQPADRVVPGHGPASLDWPKSIAPERRYLQAIVDDIRPMISQGKTLAQATKTVARQEKEAWTLFDEFHVRNVTAAFAELEWE